MLRSTRRWLTFIVAAIAVGGVLAEVSWYEWTHRTPTPSTCGNCQTPEYPSGFYWWILTTLGAVLLLVGLVAGAGLGIYHLVGWALQTLDRRRGFGD